MDRVAAAKARLRSVTLAAEEAGANPCLHCAHFELACSHPAVAAIRADPVTGTVRTVAVDAALARAENGACGPEGALFEERSLPGKAAIWLFATTGGRIVLGGAFLGGLLLS